MLIDINPKLPMRDKELTRRFYRQLGFQELGSVDYEDYLMVQKDNIQIHFFEFKDLNPLENYGQVYIRTDSIDSLYQWIQDRELSVHPAGKLETKPWGQKEFSLLDPDHNLLTLVKVPNVTFLSARIDLLPITYKVSAQGLVTEEMTEYSWAVISTNVNFGIEFITISSSTFTMSPRAEDGAGFIMTKKSS